MKKITNNSFLGKLTMIANAVVFIFFVITMVALIKFDKTNIKVVEFKSQYDAANERLVMAEHPLKQDSAEVAFYQYKLDTLKLNKPANKEQQKDLAEKIETTKQTLADKQKQYDDQLAEVEKARAACIPVINQWKKMNDENGTKYDANDESKKSGKKQTFILMAVITFVLFIAKLGVFGTYNYRNSQNLHQIAKWMKNGMPSWFAYVSWVIPIYNLIKPLSFVKEIWEETDYVLEDKAIVSIPADKKDKIVDNSGIYLAIWWALFLISFWLMNFVLYKAFFTTGPLFVKTLGSHSTLAVIAIVILAIVLVEEVFLIISYNKKNKLLVDNAEKFE